MLSILTILALALAAAPQAVQCQLVISEVFEGTASNLKYVEIFNSSASPVDLNDPAHNIVLRRYSDGSVTPAIIDLTGTIAAGDFYVIANNSSDFDSFFAASARDQVSPAINHNGNDQYELYDSTTLTVIDAFGGDLIANSADFATDLVAFRIFAQLPNDGSWGGAAIPVDLANSPSGYWTVRTITASNANAMAVGTPGTNGGAGGAEVPVELSSFTLE